MIIRCYIQRYKRNLTTIGKTGEDNGLRQTIRFYFIGSWDHQLIGGSSIGLTFFFIWEEVQKNNV